MTTSSATPERRAISPMGSAWNPERRSSEMERMAAFVASARSTGMLLVVRAVLLGGLEERRYRFRQLLIRGVT